MKFYILISMFVFAAFASADAQSQKLVMILKSDEPIVLKSGELIISQWADMKGSWDYDGEFPRGVRGVYDRQKYIEQAIRLTGETRRASFKVVCAGIEKDSQFCDSFKEFQELEREYIIVNKEFLERQDELNVSWNSNEEGEIETGVQSYLKKECVSEKIPSYLQPFCELVKKERRGLDYISDKKAEIEKKVIKFEEINDTPEYKSLENEIRETKKKTFFLESREKKLLELKEKKSKFDEAKETLEIEIEDLEYEIEDFMRNPGVEPQELRAKQWLVGQLLMETVCEVRQSEPKTQKYCETLSEFNKIGEILYEVKYDLLATVRKMVWDFESLCEDKKPSAYWQVICFDFSFFGRAEEYYDEEDMSWSSATDLDERTRYKERLGGE